MGNAATKSPLPPTYYPFLSGGGEMGSLIRDKDWSFTSVGTPDQWPQSLRTTLSIIINSKFPMFLFWGPDQVCFYNDAYRPSLGNNGKHPNALGQKGRDVWPEIWSVIKPQIDEVLAGGEATWFEDQLLPIYRNGQMEDVYWTYSYSPVQDETGKPAGVFVTVNETTSKILTVKKLATAEKKFRNMVTQAPAGICVLRGKELTVEMANENYLELVGRKEENLVGLPLFTAMPEVKSDVEPLLLNVMQTGVPYYGNEFPAQINRYGNEETFYFNFVYQPLREDDGSISGVVVVANDVSAIVEAKHQLSESKEGFESVVTKSPIAMSILRGRDLLIEIANETLLKNIWRRELHDVKGKKLLDVFPELKDQQFPALLDQVYNSGKLYTDNEAVAYVDAADGRRKYYLDFEYAPLFDSDKTVSGILITVNDVTEKVEVREKIRESEERLNIAIEAAEQGTWEVDLKTDLVIYSRKYLEIFGYDADAKPSHDDFLKTIYAKDLPIRNLAMQEAMQTGILSYEARVKTNGSLRWIKAQGKVFYEESKPVKLIGTLMDITEQKTAFNAIRESEERFKIIANTAPVMIWMSGKDKFSDFFNSSWLNFTGKSLEEERGDGWLNGVHPADMQYCIESYQAAFARKEKFYIEYRLKRHDGQYRWIADNAVPRYDSEGGFLGFISACMDIDDEKKFSETLQESEARFRLLADFMPQFVWTGDITGKLNYFNRAVYDYSGLTFEQIETDGWLQIVHPDDREENIRKWTHCIRTGEDFNMEHRFRRSDGEYRWQLSRALPQRDSNGEIQLWVGTSTDIHEMKESEQQKDYFISMASHELKTPITSMKGYVQMLLSVYQKSPEDFLKTSLAKVDKQIGTLTNLISDLLDLSKIKSGTLQLGRENFKLNELTKEIIEEIKLTEPGYHINFDAGAEQEVYADRNRIGQVLINFLTNAIKYSPNSKMILVKTQSSGRWASVSVQDTGIGISKNDQKKIFERFYRVDKDNQKTFPGFGIGLFISSEIIQRHDGKISVESEPGKGSVFHFSLPITAE